MKFGRNLFIAGAAVASVAIAPLTAAHASVHSSFPSGITIQMTDHGDTNTLGNYWAQDSGNNIATVTAQGGGNYTVHMTTEGSFVTNPGEATPNNPAVAVTTNQVVGAKATLAGTADFAFHADQAPLPNGTTIKVNGNLPRLSDFYKLLFPAGTTFAGPGLTYYSDTYTQTCPFKYGTQTAVQSSYGNTGNIFGC